MSEETNVQLVYTGVRVGDGQKPLHTWARPDDLEDVVTFSRSVARGAVVGGVYEFTTPGEGQYYTGGAKAPRWVRQFDQLELVSVWEAEHRLAQAITGSPAAAKAAAAASGAGVGDLTLDQLAKMMTRRTGNSRRALLAVVLDYIT